MNECETYFVFVFLKLSNKTGGGERGDCCDTDICGFVDIDAIGSIKSSLSLIIGCFALQSTIMAIFNHLFDPFIAIIILFIKMNTSQLRLKLVFYIKYLK